MFIDFISQALSSEMSSSPCRQLISSQTRARTDSQL